MASNVVGYSEHTAIISCACSALKCNLQMTYMLLYGKLLECIVYSDGSYTHAIVYGSPQTSVLICATIALKKSDMF